MFDKSQNICYPFFVRCKMSYNKNREQEVLDYISDYVDREGYPPTVREICKDVGFASTSTVQYYLKKLETKGSISFGGAKNRAISVKNKPNKNAVFVPLIGTVTAGTPILAVENIEGYYPLPEEFHGIGDMFMLNVSGDSMINAGIFDGDKIIVEKASCCDQGEIVVALIDDSATCKRFFKRDGKIILHPENERLQDIVLDDVSIIGKVKGLVRKF